MGLFKRLLKNVFRDGQSRVAPSSFDNLTEQQIEAHMRIARYGSFLLTDAIRPSFDLQIMPRSGFRHDSYKDKETGVEIPVLMAAASEGDTVRPVPGPARSRWETKSTWCSKPATTASSAATTTCIANTSTCPC